MPKLTIDGREIEVEAGTKVIDAAERLGIMIPRFCYHEALGAVGACRMCAVMFLEGPKKGLEMSCMIDAKDGMVVSTDHPEAQAFRASIIEWLMIDHPHDCPVCDEGGHCLLQDMTVSGGHSIRRYEGTKRTYRNQDLGPLIQHEMNRCIHCYRCVRFYREYTGYQDFGTFGIAGRVYYGRFMPGRLESPFSGNLAEICPTGVFTDKPARFRARRWDLERGPSVCLHCSLGCNLTVGVRYREVLRIEAREHPEVNGHFICDRGRYGFEYASLPQRPRRAVVDGKGEGLGPAARETALRLRDVAASDGPAAVALCASARTSLEGLAALSSLAGELGCPAPALFATRAEREVCREVSSELDGEISRSMEDVRKADFVLVIGADPVNEAPMLALAVRQAARAGAAVAVIDPRPVELHCDFAALPAARADLAAQLGALLRVAFPDAEGALDGEALEFWRALPESAGTAGEGDALATAARALAGAKRPALIVGTEIIPEGLPGVVAGAVRALRRLGSAAGIFPVLPGADSLGAALVDEPGGRSFEDVLADIEAGKISALVCAETDPVSEYPDRERVLRALDRLKLLVVLDCVPSEVWKRAHVALPTRTVFETGGCFVNQEGRLQRAEAVFVGGTPVRQDGEGSHPPRDTAAGIPGDDPRSVGDLAAMIRAQWRHLRRMPEDERMTRGAESTVLADLKMRRPELTALVDLVCGVVPEEGAVVLPPVKIGPSFAAVPRVPEPDGDDAAQAPARTDGEGNGEIGEILAARRTFGSDPLANHGPLAASLAGQMEVFMHLADAEAHELADGDVVLVPLPGGLVRGVLRTSEHMARAAVVLPRIPESGWQRMGGSFAPLALHRIWKEWGEEPDEPDEMLPDGTDAGATCLWRPK